MIQTRTSSTGPDFICIGAQKAGTSWLHWNLLFHPQTALPPEKEVSYFYPDFNPAALRMLGRPYRWEDGPWFLYRDKLHAAKKNNDKDFPYHWYRRYLYYPHTMGNYRALFPAQEGKITGDISPSYAALEDHGVRKIARAVPEARIIYLLRNPMERSWSQFKMHYPKFVQSGDNKKCLEAAREFNWVHSFYMQALERWERHFPGRVKVWFYDHLCEDPVGLFGEVCTYLNIEPLQDFAHQKLKEKIFEGPGEPMPDVMRDYFAQIFRFELRALHTRFKNPYTEQWLRAAGM